MVETEPVKQPEFWRYVLLSVVLIVVYVALSTQFGQWPRWLPGTAVILVVVMAVRKIREKQLRRRAGRTDVRNPLLEARDKHDGSGIAP